MRERKKQKRRAAPVREQSALPFAPEPAPDVAALSGIKQELNDILGLLSKR